MNKKKISVIVLVGVTLIIVIYIISNINVTDQRSAVTSENRENLQGVDLPEWFDEMSEEERRTYMREESLGSGGEFQRGDRPSRGFSDDTAEGMNEGEREIDFKENRPI